MNKDEGRNPAIPDGERSEIHQSAGAITEAEAHHVWDILVREAGATDTDTERLSFVIYAMGRDDVPEYRFRGLLGFGGKVFLRQQDDGWRVYYYPEDRTPQREQIVERTNAALAALREKPAPVS